MTEAAATTAARSGSSRTLSRLASRGAVVNLAFALGIQALVAVQGFIVPRLLGPENVGLFAIALGGVAIGRALKDIGIAKKLVQERDVDLHTSYRVAFTLEMILATTFLVGVAIVAPILAAAFDQPELWPLTTVLGLALFTTAFLELPSAIPYREMRFVRRNLLLAVGPVATFVVTIPLAYAGFGVWAMAWGTVGGFVAAAVTMLFAAPIRPGLEWDRPLMRRYFAYGWPLWVSTVISVAAGWGGVVVVSATIGIAGLGFFQLAQNWASRAVIVDVMLADAVFPILVSIQSSAERLRRVFVVTNQLSMVWCATFGFGMAAFAEPVVDLVLGPAWAPAVPLVRAQGASVVFASAGFNWDTFFAAKGETKPQLSLTLLGAGWVVGIALPLLAVFGIDGAAVALLILAVFSTFARQHYLRRILPGITILAVVWRQIASGAVAALAAVALQAVWTPTSLVVLLAEGTAYLALAGALALVTTAGPVREVLTSLRREKPAPDAGAPGAPGADGSPLVRIVQTPRPAAFPLGVAVGPDGAVWVTTRDAPALGRRDPDDGSWRWLDLPPFPHLPRPTADGGCWVALTRASGAALVGADGTVQVTPLPKTKELLDLVLAGDRAVVVDGYRRRLLVIEGGETSIVALPGEMVRPDIALVRGDGRIWVGDTHHPGVGVVDLDDGSVEHIEVPHRTRFLFEDPGGRGVWLAGSADAHLVLVDDRGVELDRVELPAIPFGAVVAEGGRVVTALRDVDALAVVDLATGVVTTVELPAASRPMGVALFGDTAWVTLTASSEIAAVDLSAAIAGRP